MADLEWLITDKFTINSGGKTPQRRKMESAAKGFSSRMCPSTLTFESPKSPLKSIENYMGGSSMFPCPSTLTLESPIRGAGGKSPLKSIENYMGGGGMFSCPPMDTEEGLYEVPQCSTLKMARLDNKENFRSFLPSRVRGSDVVRSPTRVDLSCLSPSRRKPPLATPSKFTMLQSVRPLVPPSPPKAPSTLFTLDFDTVDYASRDSGFETSLSYDRKDQLLQESACLGDVVDDDYEDYEGLRDLEEFDCEQGGLGSKYEIISTDSPDIAVARGTPVGRLLADHFQFGSPIGEQETSKDFTPTIHSVKRFPPLARTETTRMLNFDSPSPRRSPTQHTPNSLQDGSVFKLAIEKLSGSRSGRELGTFDSGLGDTEGEAEDTFLVLDELNQIEEPQAPASLHSLIHDQVIHKAEETPCLLGDSPLSLPLRRPPLRRCFSLQAGSSSQPSGGGFKRPPSLLGPRKRRKHSPDALPRRPPLHRAMSDNEATIKLALTRSLEDTDLIGDFTRAYRLPTVRSQHTDLKVITPDTLCELLEGGYSKTVPSYRIIDCRYPYEYQGGHIRGAQNLYTEEMVKGALLGGHSTTTTSPPPNIIIFHCEFSLQRGPKLVRYLRCMDRALHRSCYPSLLHPELYLLGGGYCLFSSKHPSHTSPQGGYIPMLDPRHAEERRRHQGGSGKHKGGRID